MLQTKLRDKTLFLLQNRSVKICLTDIANATGLELGWLSSFNSGGVDHPSVNRIETLYEYLTKTKLEV